jgi:CBS domain-containing protein
MPEAELGFLCSRLRLAYVPRGALAAGPGLPARLCIVKSGRVAGGGEVAEPGDCFPVAALVARAAPGDAYRAEADSFLWELEAADFDALLGKSARFRAFCTDRLALLVEESRRARRAEAGQALLDGAGLLAPLSSVLAREPVSCPPQATVGEVIAALHEKRIGSMVVADGAGLPLGIFTVQDVLGRVAVPRAAMDTPIAALMSPRPVCLPQEAPLVEAALAMVKHGIRHVVVLRDGRFAGVVSERDLFALQRLSLRRVAERIQAASGVPALAEAAAAIRELTRHLMAQGIRAEQLTQVASALNDALTQRVIALAALGRELPGDWCWLALGSEGRLEQTFVTDQDNALIFAAAGEREAARRAFLEFAGQVNRDLDACGFPLCKGEIMARNPKWCLAPEEWRAQFGDWIRNPLPEALLNASIFFDFRPLAGEARLAGELREAVLPQAKASPAFQRAMALNALTVRPPLGVLRDFAAEGGLIDLKLVGTRPFVDAARVLALARGAAETSTAARLAVAGEPAAIEAFHYIQGLRLREQGNRVREDALGALDRRTLKEAFRQAVALQERLRADYP